MNERVLEQVIEETNQPRTVHIRFGGQSQDVPMAELDIGEASSNEQVFAALAQYLGVAREKFANYTIDRNPTGNFTVRPEAVFG